jgi:hypothetical protein
VVGRSDHWQVLKSKAPDKIERLMTGLERARLEKYHRKRRLAGLLLYVMSGSCMELRDI